VKIIVDLHEGVSGIADMLAELGAEVELTPLPATTSPSGSAMSSP